MSYHGPDTTAHHHLDAWALSDSRQETLDELLAAADEFEWAERRLLAAIEGARRARFSWPTIAEALDWGCPKNLRRRVADLRRRIHWIDAA